MSKVAKTLGKRFVAVQHASGDMTCWLSVSSNFRLHDRYPEGADRTLRQCCCRWRCPLSSLSLFVAFVVGGVAAVIVVVCCCVYLLWGSFFLTMSVASFYGSVPIFDCVLTAKCIRVFSLLCPEELCLPPRTTYAPQIGAYWCVSVINFACAFFRCSYLWRLRQT